MKKSKFTEEQSAVALHQHEAGSLVGEVTRKLGVSEQTCYRWKKRFGGGPLRGPPVETTGRGEPALEADGGGLESGPAHVTGGAPKKALKPARVKAIARWLVDRFGVSARRACGAVRLPRSTWLYQSRKAEPVALKQRIREIAETRTRYGYLRIHALLRREGWRVNRKRIYRF